MMDLMKRVAYLESRLDTSMVQEAANTLSIKSLINGQLSAKYIFVKKTTAGSEVIRMMTVDDLSSAIFRTLVAKKVIDIPWWLLWTQDVKLEMYRL